MGNGIASLFRLALAGVFFRFFRRGSSWLDFGQGLWTQRNWPSVLWAQSSWLTVFTRPVIHRPGFLSVPYVLATDKRKISASYQIIYPFHSQEWSMWDFSCIFTRNITPHSNVRRTWLFIAKTQIEDYYNTTNSRYLTYTFLLKRLGERTFGIWKWKGLSV